MYLFSPRYQPVAVNAARTVQYTWCLNAMAHRALMHHEPYGSINGTFLHGAKRIALIKKPANLHLDVNEPVLRRAQAHTFEEDSHQKGKVSQAERSHKARNYNHVSVQHLHRTILSATCTIDQ